MKPIETIYKGYRFRSRLEARWAVFFDALGLKWDYEIEGFELDDGSKYLPDFYLPELDFYAEVKPGEFSVGEVRKCLQLNRPCMLLDSIPDERYYRVTCPCFNENGEKVENGLARISLDSLYAFLSVGYGGRGWLPLPDFVYGDDEIFSIGYQAAVACAKIARFEHGEKPKPSPFKVYDLIWREHIPGICSSVPEF